MALKWHFTLMGERPNNSFKPNPFAGRLNSGVMRLIAVSVCLPFLPELHSRRQYVSSDNCLTAEPAGWELLPAPPAEFWSASKASPNPPSPIHLQRSRSAGTLLVTNSCTVAVRIVAFQSQGRSHAHMVGGKSRISTRGSKLRRITIHSSRTRFAGRLNSGVRPHKNTPGRSQFFEAKCVQELRAPQRAHRRRHVKGSVQRQGVRHLSSCPGSGALHWFQTCFCQSSVCRELKRYGSVSSAYWSLTSASTTGLQPRGMPWRSSARLSTPASLYWLRLPALSPRVWLIRCLYCLVPLTLRVPYGRISVSRQSAAVPNNSCKPKPLRGSA